jgi:hypothetical protein
VQAAAHESLVGREALCRGGESMIAFAAHESPAGVDARDPLVA